VKWDFSEAFHQVLVQPRYRVMLRTWMWERKSMGAWKPRRLQNATLSQGFKCLPELMTKIVANELCQGNARLDKLLSPRDHS
jgi:hypothetical protein